jgi:glycosyltransferase involved in cell wall biosynthesis
VPLKIAAKIDKVDQEYFETCIEPLLDHPLVQFVGEVNEQQKEQLLGDALALLFPIDWPEPFGVVMIEALACGTPVIARRRGSVPEVLRDGVTGLFCETEEEMVNAVHRVASLSRAACRREFEQRFTDNQMALRYVEVYRGCLTPDHSKRLYPIQRVSRDIDLTSQSPITWNITPSKPKPPAERNSVSAKSGAVNREGF